MDFDKLNKYLNPILDRPASKKWTILKLEPYKVEHGALFTANASVLEKRPIREPNEFRECLKQALRPMFKTVVAVQLSLHEALCDVFNCEQVRIVNCKGSDLISLADMALHPLSQGNFGAYRLYRHILDSNLFDDDDDKLDNRRRARANDRAEEKTPDLAASSLVVSPSRARRFQTAGGLGVAVDESKGQKELAASSGVLSKEQREKLTAGTSALNEIKLMVDHDLEWAGKSIKFSCTLVVRGSNVITGITKLTDKGMVEPGRQVADVVADASNVIRDAFAAQDKRKGKKRRSLEGTENAEERKMVRTVAVRCM